MKNSNGNLPKARYEKAIGESRPHRLIRHPRYSQPHRSRSALRLVISSLLLTAAIGCGTTTQKLATEQLLMSDAVDSAIEKIDFNCLTGHKIYLDATYLRPIRGVGFVNADYIISSLRQQLTAAGCLILDERDQADIVIEPRVGALGTDGHEVTYGIPQTGQLSSAAAAISHSPLFPPIPEISFGKLDSQSGIAKIMLFAYDRETHKAIWQSGIAKSESTAVSSWILGAGPFQKGTIYKSFRFAGRKLNETPIPVESNDYRLPMSKEYVFPWDWNSLPDDSQPETRVAENTAGTAPETNSPPKTDVATESAEEPDDSGAQ